MILAEEQTAGRGRRGRSWVVPPASSILMSVVVFPPSHLASALSEDGSGHVWLTTLGGSSRPPRWLASGPAACHDQVAQRRSDRRAKGSRHPGRADSRFGTAQLGKCIMCELCAEWGGVIGIGMNVNVNRGAFPPELIPSATSLEIEGCGTPIDRSEVARGLISAWIIGTKRVDATESRS